MSKFCDKCGAELSDEVSFCDKCGAPQTEDTAAPKKEKSKKSKIVLIVVAVVLALIAFILIYFLFIRSVYTDPIDNQYKAYNTGDPEYIYDNIPEEYWEEYCDENDIDEDELLDTFELELESNIEEFEDEYGEDYEFSYSVLDETELRDDEIKVFEKSFEEYGIDEIDEGYRVCVKQEIDGEEADYIDYTTYEVLKIDGNWYAPSYVLN